MKLLLVEDEVILETDEIVYAQALTEKQIDNRRDGVQTIVVMRRGEVHLQMSFDEFCTHLMEALDA